MLTLQLTVSIGYYCAVPGMDTVTDVCMAGFYCPGEANITVPDPAGYECPIGYFCLEGVAQPEGCPPGSYQPDIQKDHCINCPAGYFCLSATVPDPEDCPPYHYCPEGVQLLSVIEHVGMGDKESGRGG